MEKISILFCTFLFIGCSTSSLRHQSEQINPALLKPVTDLVDNEAAIITITRATGTQGTIHPVLARAIGTDNIKGVTLSLNGHDLSATEMGLDSLLKASPHYSKLSHMLNPDNDIEPRAVASFSIDYSNFNENTVGYGENNFRKSYTYEIGLSFRLIGPEGKLAYERKFVHVDRQICTYKKGERCLEIRSKQTIQPEQTFLRTLKTAYHKALLETTFGLHSWAEVLRHLKAVVTVYHGSGNKLKTEQPATWLRKKKQADHRYLYVSLTSYRVKIDQLYTDLELRGERLIATDKQQLRNFFTTSIRSQLDHFLQAELQDSQDFEHAGIFLLPDPEAIWFKDALSVEIARAINQQEVGIEINQQGISYDESLSLGQLCSTLKPTAGGDICLSMNIIYDKSIIEKPSEHKAVIEVRQSSIIKGVLLDPKTEDKSKRYFPNIKTAKIYGVGYSDSYVKMMNQDVINNEDRIYLREAAQNAGENFAKQMVGNIIRTFQQIIN